MNYKQTLPAFPIVKQLRSIFFVQFLVLILFAQGCNNKSTEQNTDVLQLIKVTANNKTLSPSQTTTDISTQTEFLIEFSSPINAQTIAEAVTIQDAEQQTDILVNTALTDGERVISVNSQENLEYNTVYRLIISDDIQASHGADFPGAEFTFETINGSGEVISATVNNQELEEQNILRDVTYNSISLELTFSDVISDQNIENIIRITPVIDAEYSFSNDSLTVTITSQEELDYYRHYYINISDNLTFKNGFDFESFNRRFQTGLNPEYKFPEITDMQLLDKIQEATFKYFWDFAHPVSGLARERNTSGDTVTIGGSGFGLKAILVGIHRGFITKSQGVERLNKIVDFLTSADRFHGVWPHWMHGATGNTIPFSEYDDGGDLVETAFMAQGLITVREFLDESIQEENELISKINGLLDTIEWDWYTRDGQNVLYWHWSENHGWQMNMQVRGYNEALIVYLLAASSTNHGIEPDVYHQGWARSGNITNGQLFYNIELPVGYDYGGPLFFAHYSFLGLDPRNLTDTYADYWRQNRNHTLINREHSIVNPNNFVGYSSDSWGLTASDNFEGYLAHEPTRDNGTITPTAAISSIPYTPEESMDAIHHFYYVLGDKLWGEYGFHDAFNPTEGWWADSYLAIDQGPIIIMIENHRTGLLWDLFMQAPEVQDALDSLSFETVNE
ncbi:glucoamylase family protein [Rhodohalobacter sp.]|uniref:glucoamylase family protein n=1 Tax=Rhodohalobacter sp. TaxID=1974210 RepID=UPI002ACE4607|nr:glucoamylase family protein [Rhodohalobacter sp.]MDZ7757304.1 glucoamylase family protein [Rhodohalobacter sp.]